MEVAFSEYSVAFLIGLAVIWIFAWKQFTQPSYERLRRFEAVLVLLKPQDLRSNGVFFPAYVFYALILSAIYWVLCTYGSLQLLSFLGLRGLGVDSPGDSVGAILQATDASVLVDLSASGAWTSDVIRVFQAERDIPRNPSVPLAIALALVGVIPNIPFFERVEEKLRIVAHRLAGIPGRLFEGTRHLVATDPSYEGARANGADERGYLLPLLGDDYAKLRAALGLIHRDFSETEKRLRKIVFLRDVIAGTASGVGWPSYAVHGAYQRISDRILENIKVMEADLQEILKIARLTDLTDPARPALADDNCADLKRRWEKFVVASEQMENDICVLLLVYAEKDGVPSGKASATLREFILSAHHAASRDTVSFNVFTHLLVTIVLVSGLFGLVFGFDTAVGATRDVNFLVSYVVSALMMYAPAAVIALTLRQLTIDTTWSNLYREHWIKGVMQLVLVFLLATAISFGSLCIWNIYVLAQSVGNFSVVDQWEMVLRGAARQEWGKAIQGGLFAVFVVLGMDHWDSGSDGSRNGERQGGIGPALLGGLVLAIWAAATRMIVAWQNGFLLQPAEMVDQVVKTASLAFLIGAISGAVVQATLASVYTRPAPPDGPDPSRKAIQ